MVPFYTNVTTTPEAWQTTPKFNLSKIFWLNKLTAQLGDTNYRVYGELEDAFEQKSLAQCHKIQHDTDKEAKNLSGKELQDKLIAANQKMSDTVYNNTVELLGTTCLIKKLIAYKNHMEFSTMWFFVYLILCKNRFASWRE